MFKQVNLFLLLIFALGCGKSLPTIENIDLIAFKNDKNACGDYRIRIIDVIDLQKDKLLALDERQVVNILGNPDRNELYKRNQKFYYYYLNPSPACPQAGEETKRLAIRFNAMGLAKEVMIE